MLTFQELEEWTSEQWDRAIAGFELTGFYHGSAWLGFLAETGRGRVLRFRLAQDGITRGYFAALLVRKGPFRILGSPLSGSLCEYLGPAGNCDFPVEAFLASLDQLCRDRGIHQLELGSPILNPGTMRTHGYEVREWRTLELRLSQEREAMWGALAGNARNRVRRAQRLGLVAQDSFPSDFAASHYRLVQEVFGRQRLSPPITRADYQILCDRLRSAEQVFTIEVRHPARKQPIASGIFPHDGQTVYSLSTASSEEGRAWCANDLMHWSLIELAGARGLTRYRMGDNYRIPVRGGRFKDKFGARSEPVFRFIRHYSPLARQARRVLVALQRVRNRTGWLRWASRRKSGDR